MPFTNQKSIEDVYYEAIKYGNPICQNIYIFYKLLIETLLCILKGMQGITENVKVFFWM